MNHELFCGVFNSDASTTSNVLNGFSEIVPDFKIDSRFSCHGSEENRMARFKEQVLSKIWKEGVNFNEGCSKEYYFDVRICMCILAMKFKITLFLFLYPRKKA